MKTILPQNSILSRANTVTVDAEKLAQLNTLNDVELRQALGTAMARFVKTYLAHVIEENPDFTVGQALQVINMAAEDIRAFTGVKTDTVKEYKPDLFPPEAASVEENTPGTTGEDTGEEDDESAQQSDTTDRKARLFNSFGRTRAKRQR